MVISSLSRAEIIDEITSIQKRMTLLIGKPGLEKELGETFRQLDIKKALLKRAFADSVFGKAMCEEDLKVLKNKLESQT